MKGILIIAMACAACSGITPKDNAIANTKEIQELPDAADQVAKKRAEPEKASLETFLDYQAMRKRVIELFEKKEYTAAASILKRHIDKFPEHVMANTYNLSLTALLQGDKEMVIFWLEEGLRRGIFFGKWAFEGPNWKSLANHPRFLAFLDRNQKQLKLAQKKAKMKLEVITPPGYTSSKRYPLFIALHGGGENIKTFKPHWTSKRLEREFIVAYVQSSQVAAMDGYHWQEDAIAKKELRRAFAKIKKKAAVDLSRIYIGGFSSGGYGSIQALLNGVIPAQGFVLLCPELPANPSQAQLAPLVKRKVKGTLLSTELDQRLKRQRAFATYLTAKKVPLKLVVTPNIGHWYPENLPQLIDEALNDMMP